MTRRIIAAIVRVLTTDSAPAPAVHFHGDENGRPYVCESARCSSPGLTVA